MNDKALVLKDIQINKAKRYKNGTLQAGICQTYFWRIENSSNIFLYSLKLCLLLFINAF